jgi:hypothetical protein
MAVVLVATIIRLCITILMEHYATSRKVAGSSPDEVNFYFQFT